MSSVLFKEGSAESVVIILYWILFAKMVIALVVECASILVAGWRCVLDLAKAHVDGVRLARWKYHCIQLVG